MHSILGALTQGQILGKVCQNVGFIILFRWNIKNQNSSAAWAGRHSAAPPNFSLTSSHEFSLALAGERKHKSVHTFERKRPLATNYTSGLPPYWKHNGYHKLEKVQMTFCSTPVTRNAHVSYWIWLWNNNKRTGDWDSKRKLFRCMICLLCCWSQKASSSDILGTRSATFKDPLCFRATT